MQRATSDPAEPVPKQAATGEASPPPFSPSWLEAFEPLVLGAPLREGRLRSADLQLRCVDGPRVWPWSIGVRDDTIARVDASFDQDRSEVVAHTVTVGWRLLGLSVRGFHRLDEMVVEQLRHGEWRRHAMPPLDEEPVDLRARDAESAIVWHERVLDSPIGTLFVARNLSQGRLRLVSASTKPPAGASGVGSDVAWREMLMARHPASVEDVTTRRAWRGNEYEVRMVRTALLRRRHVPSVSADRLARDQVLLDVLAVLRAMRRVLRGNPLWRDLWRPSAQTAKPS
jgi:hypothetical protein